MKKHVIETLYYSETKSFGAQNSRDFFYNPHTNTLIVMNFSKDEKGNIHGGTVFRPSKGEQRFNKLHEIESGRDQQDLFIHQKNGIVALRPEMAKEFAKGYLQQRQEREIKPEKLNSSQKPGFNEKLPDLIKPPVAAKELNVKTPQGADQAKPLASRKLTR